jgi:hypothetical protein
LRIYHAFGNAARREDMKGTPHIVAAVNRLREEGYPVEYMYFDKVPNKYIKYYQAQADIVVDQLYCGWHGSNGVECLAMGKPVVVYMDEPTLNICPQKNDAPMIQATKDTIYDVLKNLVEHRDTLPEIGAASRQYALKYHDYEVVAKRLDALYASAWHGRRTEYVCKQGAPYAPGGLEKFLKTLLRYKKHAARIQPFYKKIYDHVLHIHEKLNLRIVLHKKTTQNELSDKEESALRKYLIISILCGRPYRGKRNMPRFKSFDGGDMFIELHIGRYTRYHCDPAGTVFTFTRDREALVLFRHGGADPYMENLGVSIRYAFTLMYLKDGMLEDIWGIPKEELPGANQDCPRTSSAVFSGPTINNASMTERPLTNFSENCG